MWAMPLVVLLCAAWVTAGIFAPPASAHAVLEDSSPRAGQVLASGSGGARCRAAVRRGGGCRPRVGPCYRCADGRRVDARCRHRPGSDRKRVAVRLRDGLAPMAATWSCGGLFPRIRIRSPGSFSFAVGLLTADRDRRYRIRRTHRAGDVGSARGSPGWPASCCSLGAIVFADRVLAGGMAPQPCPTPGLGRADCCRVGSAIELFVQAVYDVGGTMSSLFDVRSAAGAAQDTVRIRPCHPADRPARRGRPYPVCCSGQVRRIERADWCSLDCWPTAAS